MTEATRLSSKFRKQSLKGIHSKRSMPFKSRSKPKKFLSTSIFKAILVIALVILVYILITPLLPELQYRLTPPKEDETPDYPVSYGANAEEVRYITNGNRLFIPKISVDTKILESNSEDIMTREEGAWRDPITSTPNTLGNMVLAGHRFQYLPPNTTTFYNLDKLEIGDSIYAYWDGKEYIYTIYDKFEVMPDEVWIKDQPEDSKEITLYTCTPIYTSEKRLVVKARINEAQ